MENEKIEQAIETFARGFCFTRSFTHPYIPTQVDGIWVVRDGPRKNGKYRTEEWIAHDVSPQAIHKVVKKNARGKYAVCAIVAAGESEGVVRDGFRELNYRLGTTEPFMTHDLRRIPRVNCEANIKRVLSQDLADKLNKKARAKQILPEHLREDAPLRQYVALVDDEPIGWVASVEIDRTAWCSNLFVEAKYRRRGIGRTLMCRMLRDDRARGIELAVLTASHTGAQLYTAIGYRQIGMLLLYTPKK